MLLPLPDANGEAARLSALDGYRILDTPPEQGFDDIVRLATRLCATPIALVSLMAADRQWFKARVGFPYCETDLNASVCRFALAEPDLLIIPDLTADPRTHANPLVTGEPHIRFYAGAPLRMPDGQVLGSLCVIDTAPRPGGLTPDQAEDLRALGRQVSDLLEMRCVLASRDALLAEQQGGRKEREVLTQTQASVASAGGDLDTILRAVIAGVLQAVPAAEGAAVELIDGGDLEYRSVACSLAGYGGMRVPLHDSLDGRCALCGTAILANDVIGERLGKPHLAERLAMRAAVLAPISRAGRVVGVLKLQAGGVGSFDARDLELTRLFAAAATAGLTEVAEAEAERARRRTQQRLDILARISAALITATDPAGVIEPILAAGAESLGFDQFYIYAVDPDGLHLTLLHSSGASPEVQAYLRCVQLDGPLCGIVVETRRPFVLTNVLATTEPRYAMARQVGINAFAGYPIVSRDAVIGVISFCAATSAAFDDGTLTFFETVARYLSALRERHDGEAALRDSDARSRLAADATQLGIFDYDLVSGELRWDERLRELFGVASDTVVSYDGSFLAGLHPDDRATADAAVQAALDPAGIGTFDIEYRVRPFDDGPERWIAARGQSVVVEGRTVRFVGTVRDVTSRRRSEDALRAAEERYRLAGRATNDAIWDWDLACNQVLWNEALQVAHGYAPEAVEPTGDWWIAHIHPDDRDRIANGIHDVIDGAGTTWTDEYRFLRADGSYAYVIDRGFVIRDPRGQAVRMIGAMLDITERKAGDIRNAALVELGDRVREASTSADTVGIASEILARTLGTSRAGYSRIDLKGDLFEVERDWAEAGVASLQGRYGLSIFKKTIDRLRDGEAIVMRDVEQVEWIEADLGGYRSIGTRGQIKVPLVERGELVGLLYAHQAQARDWSPEEVAFAHGVADRTYAALGKLRAEADQRVLNEELSHRLKNTLAMVLSIATQTLRGVPERAPVEAFEQRIHALSSAHDVLLRQSWAAAPANEVVKAVLSGAGHGDRIDVSGPGVVMGARATLSLSLLLHELATNAAKYGALSVPSGRVSVCWRVEGEDEGQEMILDWTERGGPAPVEPVTVGRKGFGSRLIRMGLVGTGGVDLRYPPSGFQGEMRAPLNQLQHS